MSYAVALLLFLQFSACSEKGSYADGKIISWKDFGDEMLLQGEVLFSDEILNPMRVLVDDSILYLANTNVDNLLQLIDLQEKKVLGEFVPFGSGPQELININSIQKHLSYLYLYDMGQLRLSRFMLDKNSTPIFGGSMQFECIFDDVVVLSDTTCVALVLDSEMKRLSFFKGEKLVKTVGEYPQIKGRSLTGIEKIEGFSSYLVASDDAKRIAIVYKNTDLIEIYDIEGKLLKRVHGPDHFFPETTIETIGEYKKISSNSDKSRDAYFFPVTVENGFAVLYSGKIYNRGVPEYLMDWILVFDWEGNPVKRYKLEFPVFCISIDANGNIYGISDKPEFRILKYVI